MTELENELSKQFGSFVDFLRYAVIRQYEVYKYHEFFGATMDMSTFPVCLVAIKNIILVA